MKELIEQAFPKSSENSCIEALQDIEFGVFDPATSKCIIQSSGGKVHFTVKNPTQKTIHFLAIDKCIFFDSDEHKKCDFAVFDDKAFCFVELKSTKLKGTRNQLYATIKLFKEKISFESMKRIEAYASKGNYTPSKPAAKATDTYALFVFREELGVQLYQDGNEKVFQ